MEKAREILQAKKRRKMEDMIRREASETLNHPAIDESPLLLPPQLVRFSVNSLVFLMQFIRSPRQLAQNLKILMNL